MYEMKYWEWLAIAKHLNGVETLGLVEQQRYNSYITYGHEELMALRDYAEAYKSISMFNVEEEVAVNEDVIENVIEDAVILAPEKPVVEAPSMEDNSVAQTLALAVLSLSPVNFKVLAFVLLRTEEVSLTASAKKLGMDIRTYKRALAVLQEEKWLS